MLQVQRALLRGMRVDRQHRLPVDAGNRTRRSAMEIGLTRSVRFNTAPTALTLRPGTILARSPGPKAENSALPRRRAASNRSGDKDGFHRVNG